MTPKWEALACKIKRFAGYLSQNKRFWGVAIFNEKMIKTCPKNDLKIDPWAFGGRIFEILGRFLRRLIFEEFSIGQKSAKNSNRWRNVCQKVRMRGWRCYAADPQDHVQFNKIPTEGTDINRTNRDKYKTIRKKNLHKMEPIPVCKIPN